MIMTKRLKVTITYEYDAEPEHYDTDDPTEMAKIDQHNWDDYLDFCIDMLTSNEENMHIKVEPVD